MRNPIRKASEWYPAPRRAAKTASRTRPRTLETRVMAETSPAARAIRAFSDRAALTSPLGPLD